MHFAAKRSRRLLNMLYVVVGLRVVFVFFIFFLFSPDYELPQKVEVVYLCSVFSTTEISIHSCNKKPYNNIKQKITNNKNNSKLYSKIFIVQGKDCMNDKQK